MSIQKVGIVGNGIAGMTAAYLLDKNKYQVTIISKDVDPGGLANSILINNIPIERYYHHFFISDKHLIDFADKLGISNQITEYTSSVGFYYKKELIPFSTPLDLLRFHPIPLLDRIKMGLITLYFTNKDSWTDLEKYTCKEFFERARAGRLYEIIWKPLLRLKFGVYEPVIPATFLWGRINPRGKSRKGSKEKLQYFKGGFHTFFKTLHAAVIRHGVETVSDEISEIKLQDNKVVVRGKSNDYKFDKLIYTGNCQTFRQVFPSLRSDIRAMLDEIQYQAINCMILELSERISPYYWLNIVDPEISFAGYIEHTNLVSPKIYNAHVAYVFNYLPIDHPIYTQSPVNVFEQYCKDLKKVFPHFDKSMVKKWYLSRNPFATAIYKGKYSEIIPPLQIDDRVYLANTSQVYPEDRNVNNGIALATKLVRKYF